jgi:hypothetical protein
MKLCLISALLTIGIFHTGSPTKPMKPAPTKTIVVPFTWSIQEEMILPVKINGKVYHMALDTGASHTWIMLGTAKELNLKLSTPDTTAALGRVSQVRCECNIVDCIHMEFVKRQIEELGEEMRVN